MTKAQQVTRDVANWDEGYDKGYSNGCKATRELLEVKIHSLEAEIASRRNESARVEAITKLLSTAGQFQQAITELLKGSKL
jgi:hypothetical protein